MNLKFWEKTKPVEAQPQEITGITLTRPQAVSNYPANLPIQTTVQGTKPAGGRTFAGLASYAPVKIVDHFAARMQARNTDGESVECRSMLKRNNSYVVGKGLLMDPEPDFETIGITPAQAAEWGKKQKNRFHLWAKSKGSDITGTNNFYQNQGFTHRLKDRDGECFVRFHYSDDKNLLNPLQISIIDANQIRGDEFTFSSGPFSQEDGIIKDEDGKPTAYKVWISDPQRPGRFKDIEVPAFDEDTGRPLMIHMFKPENAGQTRGIPKIFHAIQDFQQITGYNTAALTRMENGATFNFTTENEQQDPSDMDLSQLNAYSAGLKTKPTPTTGDSTPTAIGASLVPSVCGIPESSLNETGVNIFGGRTGDKLKATPDLSPGETAQAFTDARFEHIAASIGMSPEVALMKFGSSFTAGKAGLGLQNIEAGIERDDLESDLNNIAYWAWTAEEIAAGRTQAPGWSDPIIRDAWLQNRWIPEPDIVLNPIQEATATEKNVALGREDLDSAAQRLNNSSGAMNRAKNKKQIKELTPLPKPGEVQEPDDDSDDDSDDSTTKKEE